MHGLRKRKPLIGEPAHDNYYWKSRSIMLDDRGKLEIDPQSHWGDHVTAITASHDPFHWGGMVLRAVIVEKDAWICSNVILYNCIIREGAVVAAGSVVRSCEVAPHTMVAGNPARVIARRSGLDKKWEYVTEKWCVLK